MGHGPRNLRGRWSVFTGKDSVLALLSPMRGSDGRCFIPHLRGSDGYSSTSGASPNDQMFAILPARGRWGCLIFSPRVRGWNDRNRDDS